MMEPTHRMKTYKRSDIGALIERRSKMVSEGVDYVPAPRPFPKNREVNNEKKKD